MFKRLMITSFVTVLAFVLFISPASAQNGSSYLVRQGDTLASIAAAYGTTVTELAAHNGLAWDAWVYTGQTIYIPGTASYSPAPTTSSGTHIVQYGDTLSNIAYRYGTTISNLQQTNGLYNTNFIYVGQKLVIPGTTAQPAPNSTYTGPAHERWIDVDLTRQIVTAYQGNTPVYSAYTSTGLPQTPTVVGTYQIYVKYPSARMRGGSGASAYDLPNVPHVMYFYGGYGLHGAYWHNNFGAPMSHGCVNLSLTDAEWFYNWASVGTTVKTHY